MDKASLREFRIDLLTGKNPQYTKLMEWFTGLWSELEVTVHRDMVIYHHKSSVDDWVFFYQGNEFIWSSNSGLTCRDILWCNIRLYGDRLFDEVGDFAAHMVRELTLYLMILYRESNQDEKLEHIPDITIVGLTNSLGGSYLGED